MRDILLIGLTAAVAACAAPEPTVLDRIQEQTSPPESVVPDSGQVCAAHEFQMLLGSTRAEIDEEALPRPFRVYGHLDMVTQDHRPERLNVVIGPEATVYQVFCG